MFPIYFHVSNPHCFQCMFLIYILPKMHRFSGIFDMFLDPRATHSSCLSDNDLESLIIEVTEFVLNSCIREAIIWRFDALSNLKIGTSSVSCTVSPILSMILIISLPADGEISFALYRVLQPPTQKIKSLISISCSTGWVTSMLVTDVGDQMCWWQVWDVGDRFRMMGTDLIYTILGKSPT